MPRFSNPFRMPRRNRPIENPEAIDERYRKGQYKLPRVVRRFLCRPIEAYHHRRRMMLAIQGLVALIGQYHTGTRKFLMRGCGIGGEGSGFYLARKVLAATYECFTEALIREAIQFLLNIGFIERLSPNGELRWVRCPKNSKGGDYLRGGQKATKDSKGRIMTPPTYYRLGRAARSLFAKPLKVDPAQIEEAVSQEPLWSRDGNNGFSSADQTRAGVYSGCAPYDRCGHDPNDPRFHYKRPNPMRDPRSGQYMSKSRYAAKFDQSDRALEQMKERQRLKVAEERYRERVAAALEQERLSPPRMKPLSPAALAIFNRPVGGDHGR